MLHPARRPRPGLIGWLAISCLVAVGGGAAPDRARGDVDWDVFGFGAPRPAPTAFAKRADERVFPFLPDEPGGQSVSLGTVTDGHIVQAVPLPLPGRTYSVLPRQLQRHLLYGSEEMIQAIVDASEYVDRVSPGAILWIGNIGRDGGGDIPWSVSHNSGRDADLAFYVTNPQGQPVAPPDLLHHRDDGRSREYGGYYRFDVERNWALVKALLLSPHAQMQHLFISDGLRELLLSHARAHGEPAALIAHAAAVLRQPGPEIPHDDHLHVRVYCSRGDVGAGCENTGRVHAGIDLHRSVRAGRLRLARSMGASELPATRAAAVRRIAALTDAGTESVVYEALGDEAPSVRLAAIEALEAAGGPRATAELVARWDDEPHPLVQERLIIAYGRVGGDIAGAMLERVLAEARPVSLGGRAYDLRVVAADAVRTSRRAEPTYRLVALLTSEDPELRARAEAALAVVTNQDPRRVTGGPPIAWRDPALPESVAVAAQTAWRAWVDGAADLDRDAWVVAGFRDAGYTLTGRPREDAAVLASAAGDEREWVRVNAQRRLIRMTGNEARSLTWSRRDARTYWTRWVRRNPGRVGAP